MSRRAPEDRIDQQDRPSRTQRKREVERITGLGEELTRLPPGALARLGLDESLTTAIEACALLKRSARNRQIKLIGKLLRSRDHEAIREALAGLPNP